MTPENLSQTQIRQRKRTRAEQIRRADGVKNEIRSAPRGASHHGDPLQATAPMFLQLLHRSYRSDSVLDAKLFATFLTQNDLRIRPLVHIALAKLYSDGPQILTGIERFFVFERHFFGTLAADANRQ